MPDTGNKVSFGENNIFLGPVQNVAGGDIHATLEYHFHPATAYSVKDISRLETQYALSILEYCDTLDQYFVDPILSVIDEGKQPDIASPLRQGLSPEHRAILFHRSSKLSTPSLTSTIVFSTLLDRGNQILTAPLGYGKTVLLKRTAQQAAASYDSWRKTSRTTQSGPRTITHQPKLPVYANLTTYGAAKGLTAHIQHFAWTEHGKNLLPWSGTICHELFEQYLLAGKLLLLIDLSNAVSSAVSNLLVSELVAWIGKYPNNQYIVASRDENHAEALGLSPVTLHSWSADTIAFYFCKVEGQDAGSRLYAAIKDKHPRLLDWACNPYLAHALALYYDQHPASDAQTSEIAHQILSTLVLRDMAYRSPDPNMQNEVEVFLAEAAFGSTDRNAGLALHPKAIYSASQGVGGKLEDLIHRSHRMGLLLKGRDNELYFRDSLVASFFAGKYLATLFSKDRERFLSALSAESHQGKSPNRSALFVRPAANELAWDAPLPRITQSKWLESLSMALMLLLPDQMTLFLSALTDADPFTAAELSASVLRALPDSKIPSQIRATLLEVSGNSSIDLRTRLRALDAIRVLGDPRIGDTNMCDIPRGKAAVGCSNVADLLDVASFRLDKYPVTNQQYRAFIDNRGYSRDQFWTPAGRSWKTRLGRIEPTYWRDSRYNADNHPVVGVSWFEAHAYSEWAKKRLPTEAEWERAAAWNEDDDTLMNHPTGNDLFNGIGNLLITDFEYVFSTTPVGAYPAGMSRHGVHDLVGNVWEWCASYHEEFPANRSSNCNDPRSHHSRCLRGGSWGLDQEPGAICTSRYSAPPETTLPTIGFRCAL